MQRGKGEEWVLAWVGWPVWAGGAQHAWTSSWKLMEAPCSPRLVWDGCKPCVAYRGFQGCFQLALMCKPYLLFLHGPSSANSSLPLLCAVKGSAPYVLEAERTEVIPSALGSVFHHKNLHGSPRAKSVHGNGSRRVAQCGTELACNGNIPPVENWWSAFLPGATERNHHSHRGPAHPDPSYSTSQPGFADH